MSQEHLKTMVYAKFGGQTKCIMGNVKMVNCCNTSCDLDDDHSRMGSMLDDPS